MAKQNERKESLGTFLSKKAQMLRDQRIKDGLITQEIKGDISAKSCRFRLECSVYLFK